MDNRELCAVPGGERVNDGSQDWMRPLKTQIRPRLSQDHLVLQPGRVGWLIA